MIRLYTNQLTKQLQKTLCPCYMLFGNDVLLLQESQDHICDRAREQQFNEYFSVILDMTTNWDMIFRLCKTRSLFASRQIILLILPDSDINAFIGEKILQLTLLLHDDILLILRGNKLTYVIENSAWFKALSKKTVLVHCITPQRTQLPYWVTRRAANMQLTLDDAACQLLCYCYDGNLLALTQVLKQLFILYPDGIITLPRVEMLVNDVAQFTLFHWIDAVLIGESKRAARILRQLQVSTTEPSILLRSIQREVLTLLAISRQMASMPLCNLFNHYKVWQNRRPLLIQAISRLNLMQLHNAVTLMTKIELMLKQYYYIDYVWSELRALTLLLCGKSLPTVILDI